MAKRRMFAMSVINSARFLQMSATARLLYYDLGMYADDDGVAEAFTVIRTTGATQSDLDILASKGFVTVLNEELVTHITDWTKNNQIRKDRYTPSIYKHLIPTNEHNNQMTTNGLPNDNQRLPQISIGKVSIDKVRQEEESVGEEEESVGEEAENTSHAHGRFSNVLLLASEFEQLKKEYPDCEKTIESLSAHMASTGKTYQSHYATLCKWAREDKEKAIEKAVFGKRPEAKEPKIQYGIVL